MLQLSTSLADQESERAAGLVKFPTGSGGIIQLPVRFHIVKYVEMVKKGVTMKMWLTPRDVEQTILPEVNRIWLPAGIQWTAESIMMEGPAEIPDLEEMVRDIAKANRETPDRTKMILSLFDQRNRHPVINNLYFVPFVGATSQGFALSGGGATFEDNSDGGSRCVVGVWTDKPSGAIKPPQRFPLSEEMPFKIGSIARTCSHELGHNILLQHPDKSTQTKFNRLMGGRRPGYDLTSEEITLARRVASGRAETILKWEKR
tara:strand:+ start:979 stop:1758 length:780 start_codon:yes stop_codon:yes gene_type:complete